MNQKTFAYIAAFGSGALLIGAFAFQHLGGLAPCALCITQRWPHLIALLAGLCVALSPWLIWRLIGLAGALTTAGVGLYHGLVERGILEGPDSCTAADISTLSVDELMAQITAAPLTRCDEVAWSFVSLSMAEWNAFISLGLATLWAASIMNIRRGV